MRKALRRALLQLRGAANGMFRKPTANRDGLHGTQHLQALPVPARSRP